MPIAEVDQETPKPTQILIHTDCGSAVINGKCIKCDFAPSMQDTEIHHMCPKCDVGLELMGLCNTCHMLYDLG